MIPMFITPRLMHTAGVVVLRVNLTGQYACSAGALGVRVHAVEVQIADASATWVQIRDLVHVDGEPIDYWQIRRALLVKRLTRAREWFRWVAAFEVAESWVADGFDLTDERAHSMLAHDLRYAFGHELRAEVLSRPRRDDVNVAQGARPNAKRKGWPS